MNNQSQSFLSRRGQMAVVGVGMWLLLTLWTGSAFWRHIDQLGETYQIAARCGALGSVFALLALVLWHCFDKHIGVRRWALIFAFILAGAELIHAGALRGVAEGVALHIAMEKRIAERLTEMSRQQAVSIKPDQTGTQRERLAKNRQALQSQTEIAKHAQEQVATEIAATHDKVMNSAILPRWYLNGWMYSILFILALGFVSIIFLLMMRDDVDTNFDGIVDREQGREGREVEMLSAGSPPVRSQPGFTPPAPVNAQEHNVPKS
jgi:hypothetical protein